MTNYTTNKKPEQKRRNPHKPEPISIEEAKAWDEPVNGQTLFDELTAVFSKYLALQKYQAETLALWSIFSRCFNANNIAPKLLIHSPEKRCGKTTLLHVLSELVWQPILASNMTPAVIFRVIEQIGGTIMIDEADTFIRKDSEMVGIINGGHTKKGAIVWRCDGDSNQARPFSTWAPMVIAMIGKPQDTIVDRSILITMRRKKPEEHVDRFIPHKAEKELHDLARKIARWCDDNFDALRDADPEILEELHDRAADNWRPLFAISDLISAECGSMSRIAAVQLSESEEDEDNTSPSTRLLSSIQDIFEITGEERISTEDLLKNLYQIEDGMWLDWYRGNPITPRQVARHLKPFGITPKKMRIHNDSIRGYEREQFKDAFSRYLNGTVPYGVPDKNIDKQLVNNNSSVVPLKSRMEEFGCIFDD